jgi:hypothetical protein
LIPGVGVIVFEHNTDGSTGKVVMVGDEDMYSNPESWRKYNFTVDIPQWNDIEKLIKNDYSSSSTARKTAVDRMNISKKLNRVIGMEKFTVPQKVMFQQKNILHHWI